MPPLQNPQQNAVRNNPLANQAAGVYQGASHPQMQADGGIPHAFTNTNGNKVAGSFPNTPAGAGIKARTAINRAVRGY